MVLSTEYNIRGVNSIRPADLAARLDSESGAAPFVLDIRPESAFRADAIDRETTPYLADRVAGTAVTPAPWTFPAVASLVTGQYPHEHGAMRTSDAADRGATDLVLPPDLPEDRQTLPEVFAAAGYDTYGGFAFHMPFFALGGRFESHALYDDASAANVLGDFADWFARRDDERTFSYLHLGDLHEPVDPPARYWGEHDVDRDVDGLPRWRYETDSDPGPEGEHYREHRRRLYSAAADYVDDRLAALADAVTGRDDVALVVTADHGHNLGYEADDGLFHHTASMTEGVLHTPLEIINPPPGYPETETRLFSHLDLGELLVAIAGERPPEDAWFPGRIPAETVGLLGGENATWGREFSDEEFAWWNRMMRCVYEGTTKRQWNSVGDREEYELDPARPSWQSRTATGVEIPAADRALFETPLDDYKASAAAAEQDTDFDDAVADRLEQLGYL